MAADFFTNSKGIVVKCLAVSHSLIEDAQANIEKDFIAREVLLPEPVRHVPKMGGGTMREGLSNFFDPKTGKLLEGLELSSEEQAAYFKYLESKVELQTAQNNVVINLLCLEGVALRAEDIPLSWLKRQKLAGNPLPIDDDELRMQYIRAELIVTKSQDEHSDLSQLMFTCTTLAFKGLTPEDEEALKRNFRNQVARTQNGTSDSAGGSPDRNNGAG